MPPKQSKELILINRLTLAESTQLSYDYLDNNGETFNELNRFYGQHVNEVEAVLGMLKAYRAQEAVQSKRQSSFNEFQKWSGVRLPVGDEADLKKAASAAAGGLMHRRKQELQQKKETVIKTSISLVNSLVSHFSMRLPGVTEFIICGHSFQFEDETLVQKYKEGKNNVTKVYGSTYMVRAFASRSLLHNAQKPEGTPKKITAIAELKDWHTLAESLQKAARF